MLRTVAHADVDRRHSPTPTGGLIRTHVFPEETTCSEIGAPPLATARRVSHRCHKSGLFARTVTDLDGLNLQFGCGALTAED